MDNICRFMSASSAPDVIHVINFVYETRREGNGERRISSVYRMHYVTDGHAVVQCGSSRREVKRGDVFFILPSVPYVIEGDQNFKYLYISFIGLRANMLIERFGIDSRNFVFDGFVDMEDIWRGGISVSDSLIDLSGESVLLYAFTRIGEKASVKEILPPAEASNRFLLVKKYVDDNFSDRNFSLDKLSVQFSYNKKYLSTAFKKHFKIGITEYINTVRINHACILMEQNYTSVSDIAYLCGYDDPMYFSRVFKEKMKVSPREYMKGE